MSCFVNQIPDKMKNAFKLLCCTGIAYCSAKATPATKVCVSTIQVFVSSESQMTLKLEPNTTDLCMKVLCNM